MKLFLNSFVFLFLFGWPVFGVEIKKSYVVKVGGIKIGELNWEIKIGSDEYSNKLSLKNKGFLSAIYRFNGEYFSEGLINKKGLIPKKYKHFWQTKKTIKNMELRFGESK